MELTGRPIMPPAWALGFSQCRGMLTNEKLTREIAQGYRDRQIPCDIIYQDIGWTQHLQDFSWNPGHMKIPVAWWLISQKWALKSLFHRILLFQGNSPDWHTADFKDSMTQWQKADSRIFYHRYTHRKTYDMPWPWGRQLRGCRFYQTRSGRLWGKYQQR